MDKDTLLEHYGDQPIIQYTLSDLVDYIPDELDGLEDSDLDVESFRDAIRDRIRVNSHVDFGSLVVDSFRETLLSKQIIDPDVSTLRAWKDEARLDSFNEKLRTMIDDREPTEGGLSP